jgi:tetraacyldisaccharide 4'-kinase
MSILRKILFPFAFLYGLVMLIRNYFYEAGIFKSASFDFPVICVGNLSVGGTGKTPMIEYLLNFLLKKYKVATLSRGYGRSTSGFIHLTGNEDAKGVGDEPLQFKTKFKNAIVAVDEKRVRGINILKQQFSPEIVLLDDAFQHRKVKPGYNILLTGYGDLYSDDFMLPTGNLREFSIGVERADIVVVTKCPKELSENEQNEITGKLDLKPFQKLFFSYIDYGGFVKNSSEEIPLQKLTQEKITLVTGIANPQPLLLFLKKAGINYTHYKFPDHHNFSAADSEKFSADPFILTTEKDFMRLQNLFPHDALYFLPIKMKFLKNAEEFENELEQYVSNKK